MANAVTIPTQREVNSMTSTVTSPAAHEAEPMTDTLYARCDDPLSAPSPRLRRMVVAARIARIVDYLFGLLYALLLVRLVLDFLSARPSAGFVQIVRGVTNPFYAPFKGIVATGSIEGAHVVWPLVVAILGYMLLHAGIRDALRLVR